MNAMDDFKFSINETVDYMLKSNKNEDEMMESVRRE